MYLRTAFTALAVAASLVAIPSEADEIRRVLDRDGKVVVEIGVDATVTQYADPQLPVYDAAPPDLAASPWARDSRAGPDNTDELSSRVESLNRLVQSDGTFVPLDPQQATPPHETGYEASATVDRMTFRTNSESYSPYQPIFLFRSRDRYYLSDGTSWSSGAGTYTRGRVEVGSVEIDGDTVRYTLNPYDDGLFIDFIDYDSGSHSAVGRLDVAESLVLSAVIGSNEATVTGGLTIVSNSPANYNDDRFNYFSAVVGSVVPVTLTLTQSGTWQPDTFDSSFGFTMTDGEVDFANPISVPAVTGIEINGPPQVLPESDTTYFTVASLDSGALDDVSDEAIWGVEPVGAADISQSGVLTTGPATDEDVVLTVTSTYQGFSASQSVTVLGSNTVQLLSEQWVTYQGNPQHTGATADIVDTEDFSLRWQRQVSQRRMHQVVEGDGRVFASISTYFSDEPQLFALDAVDGELLWQKSFGGVFSINPPAFAYGNVYIQNGKPGGGDPLLHAIDAATGDTIFSSFYAAQWESYLAPTIADGSVYVNGGYYGGMYRFNAFSGQQDWFEDLPQYDGWTPALSDDTAYAYVGGQFIAVDRESGARLYSLSDPDWDWNGYDMKGSVALANDSAALVVHNRRLVGFDLTLPAIAWSREENFSGQPAVSGDVIYAANDGDLYAIDLTTGATLWTWDAPEPLTGDVVTTQTHVFVRSDSTTYAVEIGSRTSDWSFPAAGRLSIGEQNLYIAEASGRLTAITMPVISASMPVELALVGPGQVQENATVNYSALVTFDDGRVRDRTFVSEWSIGDNEVASISDRGELTVVELLAPTQSVDLTVRFSEGEITLETARTIELYTPLTNDEFAARNLESANVIMRSVLEQLEDARRHERSAINAVKDEAIVRRDPVAVAIQDALAHTADAMTEVEGGIISIETAIELLQQERRDPGRSPETK